jgi:hypothetical protein
MSIVLFELHLLSYLVKRQEKRYLKPKRFSSMLGFT